MAASAAKYAHCQVRTPVPYRSRTPFRPEIVAPLDFALRAGELLALDRELDRAVLSLDDFEALVLEAVIAHPGPGGLFQFDREPGRAVGPASPGPGGPGPMVGPRRRKFLLNELRFAAENARFRPPWTEALVQEVHGLLLGDLGLSPPAGEFRGVPHTRLGARGQPLYETCPPGRIEADLRAMLDWVDRFGAALHPVVPAAVLLHGFQIIRPFPVGNATVGRTMALMYLQSFGMTNVNLVPVSSSISESPELLMRLMLWTQSTGGYTELVDFLLDRLVVAYLSATGRWLDRRRASDQLDEIALRILSRARRSPGWFSPNVASQWVGARSAATVRRHLNELVQRGFLEALGRTRGKRYRIVSSLSVLPKIADRFGGFPPGAPPFEAKSTVESAAPDPESWSSSGGETSP